jgi:hypothetical protein
VVSIPNRTKQSQRTIAELSVNLVARFLERRC